MAKPVDEDMSDDAVSHVEKVALAMIDLIRQSGAYGLDLGYDSDGWWSEVSFRDGTVKVSGYPNLMSAVRSMTERVVNMSRCGNCGRPIAFGIVIMYDDTRCDLVLHDMPDGTYAFSRRCKVER